MIRFLRGYLPEYRHYTIRLLLALLGMVLIAGSTAAIAWLMKPLLDEILIERDLTTLYTLPLWVVLAYLIKGGSSYLQIYQMSHIGQDIVRKVRDRLFSHLLTLDIPFFHHHHSGELLSRVTNDINRIQNAVSINLATLVRDSLTATALIGVVIYQSPLLAFFVLVVIPTAYFPVSMIARRLKRISHTVQERNADLTTHLNESFGNIEAIKAYSSERYEQRKFAETNRDFFWINLKAVKYTSLVIPVMEFFAALSAAAVIYIGGRQVIDGSLTAGAFFSFLTALLMSLDPLRRVSSTYSQFQDAIAAQERIDQLLQLPPEHDPGGNALSQCQRLSFQRVSLHYDGEQALSDIDLEAHQGEIIGLIGSSGSGKSSTVNLLLRFFEPTSGEIRINGEPLQRYQLAALRNQIAMVTQQIHIFNDTIAANVAYGEEIDTARVDLALQQANLADYVATLPAGVETPLQESGTNLSGGQRQRIAIARALYRNPSILIFDEATSALDNQSEAAITHTIHTLCKNRITIIIAHRLSSVAGVDRLYLFDRGEVVCSGTTAELQQHCASFRALQGGTDAI